MRKINYLEKFREMLRNRYIFHLHTDYTDGKSKIYEYFQYAYKNNVDYLVFTEHVRKRLDYDFYKFYKEVKDTNKNFKSITAIIGCEAKILPNGELDIPQEILPYIEVVCIACHSFPKDIPLYFNSLFKVFENEEFTKYVRVWVHPGRFLRKLGKLGEYTNSLADILEIAISKGIYIEQNLREGLPPSELINKIPSDRKVIGYDAHSVDELKFLRKEQE
jgi:histidinol phosphatase-like PHP family hydrolase